MPEQADLALDGEGLEQMRQSVMERFQCTGDEATARIQATWNTVFQNLLEAPLPPPPPPLPSPPSSPEPDPQPLPKEKTTFPDFDEDIMVDDRIPHLPLRFAINKIKTMDYVDLWYFTTEGCREASQALPTTPETFGLLDTKSGIMFQPIDAAKPSKQAIIDEQLSWEQLMTARHTFINMANQAGWPSKHTDAFAEFYIKLESLKADGGNPRALVLYHAVVRRKWHDVLKGGGKKFNLSLINDKLLTRLKNQIRDHDHEVLQRQASFPLARPLTNTANSPPPLSPTHVLICDIPCHATPRNTLVSPNLPSTQRPPTPCQSALPGHNHPQVAIMSSRNVSEAQDDYRDRGRGLRRD